MGAWGDGRRVRVLQCKRRLRERMAATATKLDDLMREAGTASAHVRDARTRARDNVVRSLRLLEGKLRDALGGDTLRGLADLIEGVHDDPLYGALVHPANKRFGIDTRLPIDGREALVVYKDGTLVIAKRDGASWEMRPAHDDDLRIEHLENIVAAVQEVLQRHLARTQRTAANYEKAQRLSERLFQAIGWR